jgi:hypothetical protein
MRLFLTMILTASAILAQYAAIQGTDYPANSLGILNAKPTLRTGTVAPTGNCTGGLDLWVNTVTQKLYHCGALNVWVETTPVASVHGRTGAVVATSGDYTAAQVTNALDTSVPVVNPSWLTSLPWSKLTSVPSTFAPSAHTHVAADTTGGIFDVALIPDLSAAKITSGTMSLARLAQTGATSGQAITWNGSAWAPATISGSGGYSTIEQNGTALTQRTILNLLQGTGILQNCVDNVTKTNCTYSADTSVMLSKVAAKDSTPWYCRSTSGNDTYACTVDPAYTSASLTRGQYVFLDPDTANTGAATLSIGSGTTRDIVTNAGAAPSNGAIPANRGTLLFWNGTNFSIVGGAVSGSGDVVGPASAVDSAVALFDTTTGKLLKGTANAGTAGQVLTSNGAGVSPSFQAAAAGTTRFPMLLPIGFCNGAMTFAWKPGNLTGFCALPDLNAAEITQGANYATHSIRIPYNWDGSTAPTMVLTAFDGFQNATTTVGLSAAISCSTNLGSQTYPTDVAATPVALPGANYNPITITISSITMTSCTAGQMATVRLNRPASGGGTYTGNNIIISSPVIQWTVN